MADFDLQYYQDWFDEWSYCDWYWAQWVESILDDDLLGGRDGTMGICSSGCRRAPQRQRSNRCGYASIGVHQETARCWAAGHRRYVYGGVQRDTAEADHSRGLGTVNGRIPVPILEDVMA